MLERTSYYRDDYAYDDDYRPGVMARLFGSALRHPWRTAVSLTLVVAATAIVANAVFFQSGEHPSPFFSTRDEGEVTPAVPVAQPGEEALTADNPQVDAIGRLVEVTTADAPQVQTNAASVTVVEVQQLLAVLGYEPGIVDGLFGARTRSAIEAFQSDNGMAVTGEVTDDLVAALRATTPDADNDVVAPPTEGNQILAVQTALNLIGYGPLAADGEMTAETAEAVRGFQLEYGLPVTGEIDQALIDRMVAIGALVSN